MKQWTLPAVGLIVTLAAFLGACGDQVTSPGAAEQQEISDTIFDAAVQTFRVKVYYEDGAAPYDGPIGVSGNETWDIMEASYQELFQGFSGRTVEVPKALSSMTLLADQGVTDWTGEALLDLGRSTHTAFEPQSGVVEIGLIFLNGTYEGNTTVLGVHLTGYPFAFIFKDRVAGVSGPATARKFVEQAVAVHEIGHAVGLVNNGVAMSVPHEDPDHPKHTTNEDGVMYWEIETTSGVMGFVNHVLGSGDLALFGPESLADADNFRP